jgi:hypothetical protein
MINSGRQRPVGRDIGISQSRRQLVGCIGARWSWRTTSVTMKNPLKVFTKRHDAAV